MLAGPPGKGVEHGKKAILGWSLGICQLTQRPECVTRTMGTVILEGCDEHQNRNDPFKA